VFVTSFLFAVFLGSYVSFYNLLQITFCLAIRALLTSDFLFFFFFIFPYFLSIDGRVIMLPSFSISIILHMSAQSAVFLALSALQANSYPSSSSSFLE
jgi:hypothetical protein